MTMFTDYLQKENWLLGSLLHTLERQHFELMSGRTVPAHWFFHTITLLRSEHEIHCEKEEKLLIPALAQMDTQLAEARDDHQAIRTLLAEIMSEYYSDDAMGSDDMEIHADARLGFLLSRVLRILELHLAHGCSLIQMAEATLDAKTQARLMQASREMELSCGSADERLAK